MVNSIKPQNSRNVFQQQSHPSNRQRPLGGVRQDKYAFERVRMASAQPVRRTKDMRTRQSETKNIRSKNRNVPKRQTVLVGSWVKPRVKEEIQRIAARENISISSVSAAWLERAAQQNIDMQYGALIEPVIERSIRHEMASMRWLIVRQAYDIGQMKSMLSSLLALILKNDESYNKLMDRSEIVARQSITNITPQLKQMKEILDSWLANIEKESNNGV